MYFNKIIRFVKSYNGGLAFFILCTLSYLIYVSISSNNEIHILTDRGETTPGIVTKWDMTGRHSYIYYKYKVGGKIYEARSAYEDDVKIPGGKYIVVYDPQDPLTHTILYDREIEDSLSTKINYEVFDEEIEGSIWKPF